MAKNKKSPKMMKVVYFDETAATDYITIQNGGQIDWTTTENKERLAKIIYVFLTIFLYLLKCPQSLILSALRAFCFCGKPRISRSIFLYFPCQSWLKSW